MKKKIRLVSYNYLPGVFVKPMKQVFLVFVFCMVMLFQTGAARADLPVTGVPVPELVIFDMLMQSFMADNGLEGGILAISKDGCIVYQRGFGYAYNGTDPLPENTPMRLASVEKPHTAAVIRHLVADGVISLNDFVFDVDQASPNGERRLLDARPSGTYYPYNGVYGNETFLGAVTVEHLLNHWGGWDIDGTLGIDPFRNDILFDIGIATETYPSSPPRRGDIVRYMTNQPFQFEPGTDFAYCNFGYMLLSLIIEQKTGQQHTEMIRQRVQTSELWVPSTEIIFGKDLRPDQNQREPRYIATSNNCLNLDEPFNPIPPPVYQTLLCPYGGLLMEVKAGEGNLVGSAAPLLIFMDHYNSWTGAPISSPINERKNGGLDGTSTRIQQWDTGFNVVILFNQGGGHADDLMPQVHDLIEWATGIDWPSLKRVDGFWVDFYALSSGFGGHDDPFHTMDDALAATTDGTKLRFKGGGSSWTGTISTKMLIDAPFGMAIIGQ